MTRTKDNIETAISPPAADPLIVTVTMDAVSQAFFDRKRQQHFPPERNFIPAHLTLFHHLPGERITEICRSIEVIVTRLEPFPLSVTGLRFLGFGSAFEIESATLREIRSEIVSLFEDHLTRQDRQGFRPHVTFQNKVPAQKAKTVFQSEQKAFEPFVARGEGLTLWHYRGGPWQEAATFRCII